MTTIVERGRLFLKDKCMPFLHSVRERWPETLPLDGEGEEAFFEAFRVIVASTPELEEEGKSELEELVGEDWVEEGRLEALLFFVRNLLWLTEDNPFEEAFSSISSLSTCSTSSISSDVEGEDEESSQDERLFFIAEVVLCKDTQRAMRNLLSVDEAKLFGREEGLNVENFLCFRRLLLENITYLEEFSTVAPQARPKKRQKL
jgi:hypothetical protein